MKDVLKWITYAGLFAVPFLTLHVANDYFFPFITGKNFGFRIIVGLTVVTYVALALYEPKYRPKWSWILGSAGILLVVMFFANFFGEHPRSSFWSNYERMDGYVSLVHTYLYLLILGSMLITRELWDRFLLTSLVVAGLVALGGLAQYYSINWLVELFGISGSVNRVDSTLGNAAYMAVYMLFHIFIALWLAASYFSRNIWLAGGLVAVTIPLAYVLFLTGTRGTFIGLFVGLGVTTATVVLTAIFSERLRAYRNVALLSLGLFVALCAGAYAVKDTSVVQDNPVFARFANINVVEDLRIRTIIWGMAWEGVQERPVLGWGQSNFNYVFNQNFDPRLYAQEQWFDRAHNIFMDWLIAGGFLGLLFYLGIFAAATYYLLFATKNGQKSFTLPEQAILLGLLAGYFTHNLVVFDNIISYIFSAVILALIHQRVAQPVPAIERKNVDEQLITQAALPVGLTLFVIVSLFVHRPGMAAAGDIIGAFQAMRPSVVNGAQQPPAGVQAMYDAFDTALSRDSFAHQEIVEQLSQQTISILSSQQVSQDIKDQFAARTESELQKLVAEKPGDARIHVFIASYYRAIGQIDKAIEEMAVARSLSPNKQSIIDQQGFLALASGNPEQALAFFEESFSLDEQNEQAREYYSVGLLSAGNEAEAIELLQTDTITARLAQSSFVIDAARQAGANEFLLELYKARVQLDTAAAQDWATLAFIYFELGEEESAVDALLAGSEQVPAFAPTATCLVDNIEAGAANPQEGC